MGIVPCLHIQVYPSPGCLELSLYHADTWRILNSHPWKQGCWELPVHPQWACFHALCSPPWASVCRTLGSQMHQLPSHKEASRVWLLPSSEGKGVQGGAGEEMGLLHQWAHQSARHLVTLIISTFLGRRPHRRALGSTWVRDEAPVPPWSPGSQV